MSQPTPSIPRPIPRPIPWIISVDDHVIEPPHLWERWLPAKFRARGPRVVRDSYTIEWIQGNQIPRKGGDGLRYSVPMSVMPKLGEINRTIQEPLKRYEAVMAMQDLFTVEPVK